MNATWEQLAELRAAGMRPAATLVVTTSRRFTWNLDSIGVMAILHAAGEPMPVELLEGLRVLFVLDDCNQSTAVLPACRSKGVRLESFTCWCKCAKELTSLVMPCADMRKFEAFWEQLPSKVAA